ncbi:hypothetical protein [Marinobacter subterrani]|uniref:hypothetical protein n=1 Tax=Marinobacter subterrani TaxID=1658765 RepID=UPI0023525FBF|nr:hypothetical protein [Marinobacter subterrani]
MGHTRFHELDVFHANQLPTDKVDHLLGTPQNAVVVLAQMSCTTDPSQKRYWHIHFVGTAREFDATYRDALADHIMRYSDSPIARTPGALRRHLQASRKRRRELTFLELQERSIHHCGWPRDMLERLSLPDLSPLQCNPRHNRVELTLDREFAVQTMVTQSLRIEAFQAATGSLPIMPETIKRRGLGTPLTLHHPAPAGEAVTAGHSATHDTSLAV